MQITFTINIFNLHFQYTTKAAISVADSSKYAVSFLLYPGGTATGFDEDDVFARGDDTESMEDIGKYGGYRKGMKDTERKKGAEGIKDTESTKDGSKDTETMKV